MEKQLSIELWHVLSSMTEGTEGDYYGGSEYSELGNASKRHRQCGDSLSPTFVNKEGAVGNQDHLAAFKNNNNNVNGATTNAKVYLI